MPTSADNKNKCVANGSPATHQTRLRQQGGTGEDRYIHLADWTLSVAAIEIKKKKKTIQMFMVAANKCIFKYDFRLVFVLVPFIDKILSSL